MSVDNITMRDLYPELEASLRPTMLQMAQQFAPSLGMDVDDAMQEARIAIHLAFQSYDYNRSHGGIRAFARQVIKHTFCGLAYAAATRARCPHTVYTDDSGQSQVVKHRKLASLEDLLESGGLQWPLSMECEAEAELDTHRIADRLMVLRMRLYNQLGPQEQQVFRLKARPPEAFLVFLRNIGVDAADVNHKHIARYLGTTKNSVDYSLLKIRGDFRRLAEHEFSDLVADLIRDGDWPMVHVSNNPNDAAFVRQVIQSRKLDPRPLPQRRDIRIGLSVGRIIERYHWGAVLHLKLRDHRATVVVEGRFNENTGDVFGQHGIWKPITEDVPWYKTLVQEIDRP